MIRAVLSQSRCGFLLRRTMSDIKTHMSLDRNGTMTVKTTQDVQGILDQNNFESTYNVNRKSGETFGRKVASIPTNIINMWCKEWQCTMHELFNDPMLKAKMFARLRSNEFSKLRTDNGRF